MFDQLIHLDQQLFFAINHGLSNPVFDWLMPVLRYKYTWFPLYLFLIIYSIRSYGKTGLILIGFMILTFAATDSISYRVIKPFFVRARPCNDVTLKTQVYSRVDCGTGYSFPSNHAANHFGIAMFLIMVLYRRHKWILPAGLIWAFLISFAQVYVGVHFPIDITCGAILGCLVGFLTGKLFQAVQSQNRWNSGNC